MPFLYLGIDLQDNCFFEFNYACDVLPNNLVALVMEPEVKNPATWKGLLRSHLGNHLFFDMTDEALWTVRGRELAAKVLSPEGE